MKQQLLAFIQNHWALCSGAVLVIVLLIFEEFKTKLSGLKQISAQDAVLLLNRDHALVLDLRNTKAFDAGHIIGAININQNDLEPNNKKIDHYKNKILILTDDSGTIGSGIADKLKKLGCDKVYVLAGGISAWQTAQLPLTKS